MKTGKTLQELAVELERQSHTKRDLIASASQLRVVANEEGARIKIGSDENQFEMTELAHDQLAARLDIPRKYYDRMLVDSPELLQENCNTWLAKNPTDRYLVRQLDGKTRAFLSDKYRPFDNYDVAEAALPALTAAGARIESCEVTEKKFYLKAVTERLQFEIAKGDIVQAGIVISNSEVGCGAYSVKPLIFRLVCTNGMISDVASMRRNHIGGGRYGEFEGVMEFMRDETRQAEDKAFWLKTRDLIQGIFSQGGFEKIVAKFRESKEDVISADPIKVVELSAKKFGLSQTEQSSVLQHLLRGGDLNRFGFVNAITRTAQDVESYDRATELETLGGTILELPRRDWTSFTSIQN